MTQKQFEICQGFHSDEMYERIARTWEGGPALLLVPPGIKELYLPESILSGEAVFPEPPVFALLSSGTLGRKWVFYSRKNIESNLKGIFSFFDLTQIEEVFCYPQPYHVFGLVLGYLFSLIYSKRLEFYEGPYSRGTHEVWRRTADRGTLTLGTPTHFQDAIAFVRETKRFPRRSYASIAGGASVSKTLWEQTRDVLKIQNPSIGYGASELSPGATHLPPGQAPQQDGEIGVPLPGVTVEIHPGVGLRVTGDNVCLALTQGEALLFPKEIWLRDEVTQRADGVLVFSNRTDLVLNRGGEKFSLEQIEARLWNAFEVKAVGVNVPHSRLGEELALVVEDSPQARATQESLFGFLKTEWGRDFDPSLYFFVPQFPLDKNSKIDRPACRALAEMRRELSS